MRKPLSIDGAWTFTPEFHHDNRGCFAEWFQAEGLSMAQGACSISARGVIRGIHVSDVPPGRAKYVLCADGALLDVVVDLRIGSPTFGRWEAVELTSSTWQAVYLAEGLGHAFMALSPRAVMLYLHSTPYDPAGDRAVHAFDPDLGIRWPQIPAGEPCLSARDRAAPSLKEALRDGLLPSYTACEALGGR